MSTQTTPHTEPDQRFSPDEFFQAIERNRGRLHVLEYACFGLAHTDGKNASCLVWVIGDILADLDQLEHDLSPNTNLHGGNNVPL